MTDNESSHSPKLEELDLTELHIDRNEEAPADQEPEEIPASPILQKVTGARKI